MKPEAFIVKQEPGLWTPRSTGHISAPPPEPGLGPVRLVVAQASVETVPIVLPPLGSVLKCLGPSGQWADAFAATGLVSLTVTLRP